MLWNFIQWLFGFYQRRKIHGNAKFLQGFSRSSLLNKRNNGLVVDGIHRLSLERSYSHLAIVAPTGAGKTTRFVLPNILNMKDASFVVTDPSGEILQKSEAFLRRKGYNVLTLNFTNIRASHRYNPLSRCQTHSDTRKMAEMLIDAAYQNSHGNDLFWNDSAKGILNLLIRAIKRLAPHQQNLGELYRLLNQFGHGQEEVNRIMSENLDEPSFEEFKAFLSQDDRVMNSILSTAKTALASFSDPGLALLTREDTVAFERLRTEKTALFVIVPEHEVRYYNFMLTVLYTQIFNFCMQLPVNGMPYLPIFFFLDEFGNSGKLPNFSTMMTTLRKRKVSVSLVLQDVEQLVNVYGQADASVILNGGCASRIFYPGLSHKTCDELSRILGTQTVKYRESGFSRLDEFQPDRDREMGIPLMRPEEIMTMPQDRAIFTHANLRPALLKTRPWFRIRKLKRRVNR
ncbi:type IV secretion system DNA-binding domain-containing protein [Maribellus comscasis]|uniref:Type IV secretion system DNA-binding domain-containing protein n=1 Tax=Maribellus comscasis TaxID=2681766 RepID=A0A6I6K4D4_9BACT|nr:type IV secretory system conjugative DNA transfer family protein [Maribellus comscasis]QGY44844.1 type IV secretion system DNA-binding domain-containing protein [Maribellus comscasis]